MVPLWGTKWDNQRDGSPHNHNVEATEPRHIIIEPDEHTRLLPQPSTRGGYLSPDDPAVSWIQSTLACS
jgi:hypothetical protein